MYSEIDNTVVIEIPKRKTFAEAMAIIKFQLAEAEADKPQHPNWALKSVRHIDGKVQLQYVPLK